MIWGAGYKERTPAATGAAGGRAGIRPAQAHSARCLGAAAAGPQARAHAAAPAARQERVFLWAPAAPGFGGNCRRRRQANPAIPAVIFAGRIDADKRIIAVGHRVPRAERVGEFHGLLLALNETIIIYAKTDRKFFRFLFLFSASLSSWVLG
jgi:hypothetical protein